MIYKKNITYQMMLIVDAKKYSMGEIAELCSLYEF